MPSTYQRLADAAKASELTTTSTARPDRDLDLGNLTRRQATVFEQLCIDAVHGHRARLDALDYKASLSLATPETKAKTRAAIAAETAVLRDVQHLERRLRRIRMRVLTKAEWAERSHARLTEGLAA